jgi:hypothetical protein
MTGSSEDSGLARRRKNAPTPADPVSPGGVSLLPDTAGYLPGLSAKVCRCKPHRWAASKDRVSPVTCRLSSRWLPVPAPAHSTTRSSHIGRRPRSGWRRRRSGRGASHRFDRGTWPPDGKTAARHLRHRDTRPGDGRLRLRAWRANAIDLAHRRLLPPQAVRRQPARWLGRSRLRSPGRARTGLARSPLRRGLRRGRVGRESPGRSTSQ